MKRGLQIAVAALLMTTLAGGVLELHREEHGVALEESAPVFSTARHHQDPAHLEGAELSQHADCPACLLLKSPGRLLPSRPLPLRAAIDGLAVRVPAPGPLEPHPLLHTPRGPPLS